MNKTAVSSRPARSLPMPLWMQGSLELLLSAFYSYLAVALLLGAVWFTNGFEDRSITGVLALAGNSWLLMHGVPLQLSIPAQGMFEATSGTMAYAPLGLTLIPLTLLFYSGRRLARASYEGQFWVPSLAGVMTYAVIAVGLGLVSANAITSASLLWAALIPGLLAMVGVVAGGWYESRSLARMIGVNAADGVKKFSQYSRWAGSYAWAVVRASLVAVLAFIAGGALLLAISLFYNWNDVLVMYQSLRAGAVGDTAVTLLQLGIVPNLVVYAMAFSTGAGFSLGENTLVGWQGANVGLLPTLPVLGAIPNPIAPWSYLTVLVPILAGVLAGWWFFREGENHFDEWLSLKIRFRWVSLPLSVLFLALVLGLLAGLWSTVLGWAAHGSLGLGRFTDMGPQPLYFGLLAAAWIAVGVMIGSLLAPLLHKDTSLELERFAEQTPQAKKERKLLAKQEAQQAKAQVRAKKVEAKKAQKETGGSTEPADSAPAREPAGISLSGDPVHPATSKPAQALAKILDDTQAEVPADSVGTAPVEQQVQEPETVEHGETASPDEPVSVADAKTDAASANLPSEDHSENATTAAPQESSEQSRKSTPEQPKLSRGAVIRRPKNRRK